MVAAVCTELGIPMGRPWAEHTHEDADMFFAIENQYFDMQIRLINERDSRTDHLAGESWGFKFPNLHRRWLPGFTNHLTLPRIVCINRDTADTAASVARHGSLDGADPRQIAYEVAREQYLLATFWAETTCPVLNLSYRLYLEEPAATTMLLADFLQTPCSEDRAQQIAQGTVAPRHPGYAQTFREERP